MGKIIHTNLSYHHDKVEGSYIAAGKAVMQDAESLLHPLDRLENRHASLMRVIMCSVNTSVMFLCSVNTRVMFVCSLNTRVMFMCSVKIGVMFMCSVKLRLMLMYYSVITLVSVNIEFYQYLQIRIKTNKYWSLIAPFSRLYLVKLTSVVAI